DVLAAPLREQHRDEKCACQETEEDPDRPLRDARALGRASTGAVARAFAGAAIAVAATIGRRRRRGELAHVTMLGVMASPRDAASTASPRDAASTASPRDAASTASPRDAASTASPRDAAST